MCERDWEKKQSGVERKVDIHKGKKQATEGEVARLAWLLYHRREGER